MLSVKTAHSRALGVAGDKNEPNEREVSSHATKILCYVLEIPCGKIFSSTSVCCHTICMVYNFVGKNQEESQQRGD